MNTRRKFKIAVKDYNRGLLDDSAVASSLMGMGLFGDIHDIRDVLRTSIRGRILSRIGKAAKKNGGFVRLRDLFLVFLFKLEGRRFNEQYVDYHLVPFLREAKWTVVTTTETHHQQFRTLDDKPHGGMCSSVGKVEHITVPAKF